MPSTVNLQGGYMYGLIPLWILGVVLLVSIIKYRKYKKMMSAKPAETEVKRPEIKHVTLTIKEKYVKSILDIKNAYLNNDISAKEGYQRLSFIFREFIEVSTGFNLTRKTLSEIKLMNLPAVEELINDIYKPEFSEDNSYDLEKVIDRAVKVIEEWS